MTLHRLCQCECGYSGKVNWITCYVLTPPYLCKLVCQNVARGDTRRQPNLTGQVGGDDDDKGPEMTSIIIDAFRETLLLGMWMRFYELLPNQPVILFVHFDNGYDFKSS